MTLKIIKKLLYLTIQLIKLKNYEMKYYNNTRTKKLYAIFQIVNLIRKYKNKI